MYKIVDVALDQMSKVAKPLAEIACPGDIFILQGEIGAGKTTLVANVAELLGVEEEVTSPTFAIVTQYEIPDSPKKIKKLIHIDTYRLENLNELYELGFETLFDKDCVTFIEWGERIVEHIDTEHFTISIDESEVDSRTFEIGSPANFDENRSKLIRESFLANGWFSDD